MEGLKKKLKYEHPIMVPLKDDTPTLGVCGPGSVGDIRDDCGIGFDPVGGNCDNGTKAGSCNPNGISI